MNPEAQAKIIELTNQWDGRMTSAAYKDLAKKAAAVRDDPNSYITTPPASTSASGSIIGSSSSSYYGSSGKIEISQNLMDSIKKAYPPDVYDIMVEIVIRAATVNPDGKKYMTAQEWSNSLNAAINMNETLPKPGSGAGNPAMPSAAGMGKTPPSSSSARTVTSNPGPSPMPTPPASTTSNSNNVFSNVWNAVKDSTSVEFEYGAGIGANVNISKFTVGAEATVKGVTSIDKNGVTSGSETWSTGVEARAGFGPATVNPSYRNYPNGPDPKNKADLAVSLGFSVYFGPGGGVSAKIDIEEFRKSLSGGK